MKGKKVYYARESTISITLLKIGNRYIWVIIKLFFFLLLLFFRSALAFYRDKLSFRGARRFGPGAVHTPKQYRIQGCDYIHRFIYIITVDNAINIQFYTGPSTGLSGQGGPECSVFSCTFRGRRIRVESVWFHRRSGA